MNSGRKTEALFCFKFKTFNQALNNIIYNAKVTNNTSYAHERGQHSNIQYQNTL